ATPSQAVSTSRLLLVTATSMLPAPRLPASLSPTPSVQSTRATARPRSPTTAPFSMSGHLVSTSSAPGSAEPPAPTRSLVLPWLLLALLATLLSALATAVELLLPSHLPSSPAPALSSLVLPPALPTYWPSPSKKGTHWSH
ncbi:hypothetical protein RSAG8_06784, partial [Rhizoctonia solani AG-8 WAC10335]